MYWALLKTVLALIFIIGLMIVIVYFLRRYLFGSQSTALSSVKIDVIGHRMLQPKRSIFVLKILDRILVVGTTEQGMDTLCELDPAQLEGAEALTVKKENQQNKTFVDYLKENLGIPAGGKKKRGIIK